MKIPILMYHQIDAPPPRGASLRGLVVSPTSFGRQMALLKLLGYRCLSMHDLEPYLQGKKQGKVVGLTFDDGYQNNLQYALPVLVKNGFTATCYAVSNAMGGSNSWDKHLGIAQKPLMTVENWLVWLSNGMEVGSHTRHHVDLTKSTAEQALDEIKGSKQELQTTLGCEIRHFCYPYGWYSAEHRQLIQLAGYISATTTQRGRVQEGDDMYTLKRIMVARATHLGLFAAKILSNYEDRRT
ncbi:MAG: polysaccharide deacetylase [Burkholderiales bacterium RIFCSPLOWO2_02_FULL_57_36]|nr:polysaccharide deacetylase family protein [Rhodoferax sp.]MDP3652773.1 polysaccharide deacetylase family protein [Rhodoferax sp.]OGB22104.1 MAG: polysaccharide deacetylase [Burkholderiales bacterium RIFCSPLOWO2_02_FULL_57_36]